MSGADRELQPGESKQVTPAEYFCVSCQKPRPRAVCTMCGRECVSGDAVRAGEIEGAAPEAAALAVPRYRRRSAATDALQLPAVPSAPRAAPAPRVEGQGLEALAGGAVSFADMPDPGPFAPQLDEGDELEPPAPPMSPPAEPDGPPTKTRRGKFARRTGETPMSRFGQTQARTYADPQPETDDQGRAVVRMQRDAPQGGPAARDIRNPEAVLERIRATATLNETAWLACFSPLLQQCQTEDDIQEAAHLADLAYLQFHLRVQGA